MENTTRSAVETHWNLANRRDWGTFQTLLAPELKYHVPQTRERIDSGLGYLDMFETWPGDWKAEIEELICEGPKAVCRIRFKVGEEEMTGISFFEFSPEGRIVQVTEFWPEPYEPPPRSTAYMIRY